MMFSGTQQVVFGPPLVCRFDPFGVSECGRSIPHSKCPSLGWLNLITEDRQH